MTPFTRAFSIFTAGIVAVAVIVLLLHDPPYPVPRQLGISQRVPLGIPSVEENLAQQHLVALPTPRARIKIVNHIALVGTVESRLIINNDTEDYTHQDQIRIVYQPLYNQSGNPSDYSEESWHTVVNEQVDGTITALPNDSDNWIHVLYYVIQPYLQFHLRSYRITDQSNDGMAVDQCDKSIIYPINESNRIIMCDIKLPEHGWIEDAIVDKGLFIYSRRPDIARFRMYTLPYYTLDNNDHTATVTTTIGPIINERMPERVGLCRLPTTTNITRILLAEVRQLDPAGRFDFKVRLVSNAGQSDEVSRDVTRRWTHMQMIDTFYYSTDSNRMNSNFNHDSYDDAYDIDGNLDEPKLLALSKPMPIITSELRTTIVAFPHSQVVYSLDEVNEVQGQYELRSLEIPYVENVINSVVGLYVSHEGTHLVIVTADNTVMLFTRGIGDSLLDLLLKYDTRNIENNEGENKDRYGGSGSRQLNLLRNVRDDLARRWRLKAIIPTRSNVTSVVDAAFVDGANKVGDPILVLLHADDRLSQWQITNIYANWSWPLILYSKHWILCLILLFIVVMFSLHELRLR